MDYFLVLFFYLFITNVSISSSKYIDIYFKNQDIDGV